MVEAGEVITRAPDSALGDFPLMSEVEAWVVSGDVRWPGSFWCSAGYVVSAGIAQLAQFAGLSPAPGSHP
jgi:hypothetical protein